MDTLDDYSYSLFISFSVFLPVVQTPARTPLYICFGLHSNNPDGLSNTVNDFGTRFFPVANGAIWIKSNFPKHLAHRKRFQYA
jgi:hypothetical protein